MKVKYEIEVEGETEEDIEDLVDNLLLYGNDYADIVKYEKVGVVE